MSRFRDKFVTNVGPAETPTDEAFHFHNAAPLHQATSRYSTAQPYSPLESSDPYRTQSADKNAYRYDAGHVEQHELASISSNPFNERTEPYRTEPYRADEERGPFASRLDSTEPDAGYAVYPDAAAYDYSDKSLPMTPDQRRQHHERNRRLLQNRYPRFHVTKLPWFSMLVTTAQVVVFIVELVRMAQLTGSPFQTKPYFNPMLGPSTYLLINLGARYVPCMHRIASITLDLSIEWPCPNSTSTDTDVCGLGELCGISGVPIVDNEWVPDQWYRLIVPIFLHAGFLHIGFNLLLQVLMGFTVERSIGWLKYAIIYMASGIAGFLLGANFSPNGVASTGASGALFGVIACNFLLFIFAGRKNTNLYGTTHYKLFIAIMVTEVVVSFVLGLLPGLDNFSHIGGFCMGVLLSIVLLPDPSFVYVDGIYTYDPETTTMQLFWGNWNPLNKYNDKIRWKVGVWALARVVCLTLAILFFALLAKNLYSKKQENNESTCSWCKYINCLPVHGWCEMGEVTVETSSDSSTSATATASNTATNTASATVLLVASASSTLASSIENPNAKRHLDFGSFAAPATNALGHQPHHVGTFALMAIMGIFAVLFMRRTRK